MSLQRINSPIPVTVQAFPHSGNRAQATFHVVKLEVSASVTGTDGMGIMSPLSKNVNGGEDVTFDISSALRAAADGCTFTPTSLTMPSVTYTVRMYEEYLLNGKHNSTDPRDITEGVAYLGGYTDYERITDTKPTTNTRKPLTSPETVAVGDTFLAPAPEASASVVITEPGIQQVQGHTLYAVPQNRNRYQFRFINGLGAMESVSIECYPDESVTYNTEQFQQTRPDYMGGISHTRIAKSLDIEQMKFSTGPLTREWRHWYAHEFLMSEHVWISLPMGEGRGGAGAFVPVLIIPEETTPLINRQSTDLPAIDFTVKMNFNG